MDWCFGIKEFIICISSSEQTVNPKKAESAAAATTTDNQICIGKRKRKCKRRWRRDERAAINTPKGRIELLYKVCVCTGSRHTLNLGCPALVWSDYLCMKSLQFLRIFFLLLLLLLL